MTWRRTFDRNAGKAFAGLSVGWAALLPIAAFGASRPHQSAWLWSATVAIYGLGATICHQLPARSFHLWSAQLPVCARCTGIYAGAALVALVCAFREGLSRVSGGPRHVARAIGGTIDGRWLFLLGSVPTAATLAFEWASGVTPSNSTRALAGLPLGAAVAWLVIRVN